MATGADGEVNDARDAALSRIDELEQECLKLTEWAEQMRRELRFAKADIEVKEEYIASKDEYIASLESGSDLEATLEMLRAKTAYIESLPSVRLKVWIQGVQRRLTR
jgi:predicted metal-binding transcription factor (methanogenesis marker protein 9)